MADIEQLRPQRARVARKPASSRPEQRPVPDPEGPSTRRRSHKQRKQEGYTVARTLASAYSCAWQLLS